MALCLTPVGCGAQESRNEGQTGHAFFLRLKKGKRIKSKWSLCGNSGESVPAFACKTYLYSDLGAVWSGNFNWVPIVNFIHQAFNVCKRLMCTLFGKTYLGIISFAWLEISSLLMVLFCSNGLCKLQQRLWQRRALNANTGHMRHTNAKVAHTQSW